MFISNFAIFPHWKVCLLEACAYADTSKHFQHISYKTKQHHKDKQAHDRCELLHWSQSCFYSFYDDTFLLVAAVTCRFSCHITKGKFYQPDVTDLRNFLSSTVADILLYWHFAILATSWTSYHIKGLLFGSYSAWANRDFPHMMDLLQIVNEWSPLTSQEGGGGGYQHQSESDKPA